MQWNKAWENEKIQKTRNLHNNLDQFVEKEYFLNYFQDKDVEAE